MPHPPQQVRVPAAVQFQCPSVIPVLRLLPLALDKPLYRNSHNSNSHSNYSHSNSARLHNIPSRYLCPTVALLHHIPNLSRRVDTSLVRDLPLVSLVASYLPLVSLVDLDHPPASLEGMDLPPASLDMDPLILVDMDLLHKVMEGLVNGPPHNKFVTVCPPVLDRVSLRDIKRVYLRKVRDNRSNLDSPKAGDSKSCFPIYLLVAYVPLLPSLSLFSQRSLVLLVLYLFSWLKDLESSHHFISSRSSLNAAYHSEIVSFYACPLPVYVFLQTSRYV